MTLAGIVGAGAAITAFERLRWRVVFAVRRDGMGQIPAGPGRVATGPACLHGRCHGGGSLLRLSGCASTRCSAVPVPPSFAPLRFSRGPAVAGPGPARPNSRELQEVRDQQNAPPLRRVGWSRSAPACEPLRCPGVRRTYAKVPLCRFSEVSGTFETCCPSMINNSATAASTSDGAVRSHQRVTSLPEPETFNWMGCRGGGGGFRDDEYRRPAEQTAMNATTTAARLGPLEWSSAAR